MTTKWYSALAFTRQRNSIIKRFTALLLLLIIFLSTVGCGKVANKKAIEMTKEICANIETAYNICATMGSDIISAWYMGIYNDDDLMNDGVGSLDIETSLTEEEIIYSVYYFTCTIFFATEWTEEYANDMGNFGRDVANSMFTLADGEMLEMFDFAVKIVEDAYMLNGKIEEAEAALNNAKQLIKELGDQYPNFEYYSVVKDYYLTTNSFLNYCKDINGTYDQAQNTINDYKNKAREHINALSFILED